MEFKLKQIEEIRCSKCGGCLILKDSNVGVCVHCGTAFLLTQEEAGLVKEQEVEETVLQSGYISIVSKLCHSNKSWAFASDELFVSRSMRKSLIHKGKMKKVKKNFEIPEEDDVYVICNTSIGFTQGFALATSGFYYLEDSQKKKGKMTWKAFKQARIMAAGRNMLLVDDLQFEIYFSSKDVERILKTIQANI